MYLTLVCVIIWKIISLYFVKSNQICSVFNQIWLNKFSSLLKTFFQLTKLSDISFDNLQTFLNTETNVRLTLIQFMRVSVERLSFYEPRLIWTLLYANSYQNCIPGCWPMLHSILFVTSLIHKYHSCFLSNVISSQATNKLVWTPFLGILLSVCARIRLA